MTNAEKLAQAKQAGADAAIQYNKDHPDTPTPKEQPRKKFREQLLSLLPRARIIFMDGKNPISKAAW